MQAVRVQIATVVGSNAPETPPSRLQQEVAAALTRLDIPHTPNVPVKNNLFAVDVVLQRPREQVCFLLLQASDVVRASNALLGHALYRVRLLEAYGWRVLSVGHWQWEQAGEEDAQEALLLSVLQEAGLA